MNISLELLLKQSCILRIKTHYFCSVGRLIHDFQAKARAHINHHLLLLLDNDLSHRLPPQQQPTNNSPILTLNS
jgi:hypothetical protein